MDADKLIKEAMACHRAGDLKTAEARFAAVLKRQPGHVDALFMLGTLYLQAGVLKPAVELLERAAGRAPGRADILNHAGIALRQSGRLEQAEPLHRQAVALVPDNAGYQMNLAVVLQERGKLEEALGHYRDAVSLTPDNAGAWFNLGVLQEERGDLDEAVRAFREAVRCNPGLIKGYGNLGHVLTRLGRHDEAVESFREAADRAPDHIDNQLNLAVAFRNAGDLDAAIERCDRILAAHPNAVTAIARKAGFLEESGAFDAAMEIVEPVLEAGRETPDILISHAKLARHFDREAEAVERLEHAVENGRMEEQDRAACHFQAGALCDRLGAYDRAFAHYRNANQWKREAYDPRQAEAEFARLKAFFTPERVAGLPRSGKPVDLPVFIVGMPRSGTTLVEQVVSSHPSVFGAGELPDLHKLLTGLPERIGTRDPYPECLADITEKGLEQAANQYLSRIAVLGRGAERVTDKMPENFLGLGAIALLFPGARVIHCRRDPLDTCLSCHFQQFATGHGYTHDLHHLGHYYRLYEDLMAHWERVLDLNLFTVRYADMVDDQEAVARELIDFVGLTWDPACLKFYEQKRQVRTASYDQVRKPIYRGSVARWRNYADHLGPLREALGDLAAG